MWECVWSTANPKEHIKSVQEWAEACGMSEVRMKHIEANKNEECISSEQGCQRNRGVYQKHSNL
ncbi:hypothetical protein DN757_16605 [Paenibacillus silvae]|uniref:Uncharacterized protein n=1 Tax=Paenibacillus silvae TaxID=1325358 RepID=A0A2W6NEL6_9BACL|nr:hypothetical protein DN757_16605 [Paenibacillus silvae]